MKKRVIYLLIIILLFFLAGCATHQSFVQKYNSWIGQHINNLVQQIGYPDSTYLLENKNKVYVYEHSNVYSPPSMPIMGYGYGGYYRGYGMIGYSSETIYETCKLFIETNRKGIITKWGSRGNSCVSN